MRGYYDRGKIVVNLFRGEGDGVNVFIVILASFDFNFIRVHNYLVQDPRNNKSITLFQYGGRKQCRFKLYTRSQK